MKVATKKPAITQVPVYVTDEKYEIWISQPVSLGTIDKVRGYWYTIDGMRFVSSRDAMRYLVAQHAAGNKLVPAPKKEIVPQKAERSPRGNHLSAVRQGASAGSQLPTTDDAMVNQNHPMFQEFLDFLEYRNSKSKVTLASGDRRQHVIK